MLDCNVVRDLLPAYLENLTEEETKVLIEEHLRQCEECRGIKAAMEEEIDLEKPPKPEMNFLKKWKRRQLMGAALTILITLFCLVWLYNNEFNVDASATSSLEAAIAKYNFTEGMEVDVLDSEKIGNRLFVFYEREDIPGQHGLAELERGILGKYRFQKTQNSDQPLYNAEMATVGGRHYLLIYGLYNLPGVETFSLAPNSEYAAEPKPPIYSGRAKEAPFLEVVEMKEWTNVWTNFISYYNAEGIEISPRDLEDHLSIRGGGWSNSVASMEPYLVYAFMGIVLFLGVVITRYFLDPLPKKDKTRYKI